MLFEHHVVSHQVAGAGEGAFLGSLIGHGLSTARSHDCSSFIRKILSSRVETPQSGRLNTWLCGKVRLFNLSHPVA